MKTLVKYVFLLMLATVFAVQAEETLVVGEDEIAAAVMAEFAEQGLDEKLELDIFGGQTSFAVDGAKVARVMISRLKYDPDGQKFTANAEIFADGQPYAKTSLSGKYYILSEAWVPAVNIEKDTIITKDMLKTSPVRTNRVKALHVTDLNKIVDMQAKKSLKIGRLITDRDIGAVVVLKKGKIVTSVYATKGMQITAQAEALQDGVKGRVIEVMNTKSGKKFYARVVDADTVEIQNEQ